MNFDFTDDQHEIKRTARDLLADALDAASACASAAEARAYDDALWRELVRARLARASRSPRSTAARASAPSSSRSCSRSSATPSRPSPFLATALAAAVHPAGRLATSSSARWLPGAGRPASCAARSARPDGAASSSPTPPARTSFVLVDGDGVRALRRRATDADVEPVDVDRPDAPLRARVTRPTGEALAATSARGVDRATVAVAAELVGVCQRALEMTLAYVKERKQFDTPVGAYQAVSHRCAQMLRDTEGARSATYFAAWAADAEPERLAEAAVAGQGRRVGRRARRHRLGDPGPRRHRLHLGGRRALALQARPDRRGAAGRRGRAPRAAGPDRGRAAGAPATA